MSRREFLKGILPKSNVILLTDKEKCTGCGLCAVDCPTGALIISLNGKGDTYQLFFRYDLCNACANCEKSCPEHCLQLEQVEQEPERGGIGEEAKVIFEDKISRCIRCGISLFPQAMVKNLKPKIFSTGEPTWSLNLCPSCRIKTQFEGQGKRTGRF